MPLSTASAVFAARGELSFLAELARAAYHLRVDANPIDGIDSNEWPSVLFGVDPAVDPSFAVAGQVLQLMNPSDFGSAGAGLQLDGGLFYTDGLENGIFTTSNAAALVARAADALFISFRGTNDSIDLVEDAFGQFDVHWAKFAALRSALTAFIALSATSLPPSRRSDSMSAAASRAPKRSRPSTAPCVTASRCSRWEVLSRFFWRGWSAKALSAVH